MKKTAIALALAALATGAAAAPASALMHAAPNQHWVNCGRVNGHNMGVTQPGTSCSLGRNAARVAMRHRPGSHYQLCDNMMPRSFSVRAYSGVTHKYYRLRASYRTGELGIWNPHQRRSDNYIAISVDFMRGC